MNFEIPAHADCQNNDMNHQKKVFVFDLHDVLFARNYSQTIKLLWAIKNKKKLFSILFSPRFICDAFQMLSVTRVSEAYIIKLSEKHAHFKPYVDTIIDITNALIPIWEMFSLIENLKHKGHKVYIFSNIGRQTYHKLIKPYQHLFECFDGIHYVEDHNNWLAKPNHNAYLFFLKKFDIKPQNMIFIDDKPKNIIAAQELGITGVLYKSCNQVYKQFMAIKVFH